MLKPDSTSSSRPIASEEHVEGESLLASRRSFVMLGMSMFLAGCATTQTTSSLPGPIWQNEPVLPPEPTAPPPPKPNPPSNTNPGTVLARSQWSQGAPAFALMNRMLPVQYI